ncbi:MAG: DUF29 domain-containing protein [Gloeomargarita sp. SKYG116]|nr:DUF29 domain-containing protein [Gloeomargarita sp. SKYG116]MCS7293759.1 DUF29 domain-containing protein [Gloeomargarita sp. SKYB120]MDW8179325.1 DUF29 domain-containing protein [Gloeomargarita sp. SKYBB_i_bin120]MDW8400531.1 DUF29 domain-containing protein [Gloeomargarita sp. SKYGB_i_bin116]
MASENWLHTLYEQDIGRWAEETVVHFQKGDFAKLDIEHLIEEIEALGISQKKEFVSCLVVLLEHLLKRMHVPLPAAYNGWERTIRTQRAELKVLLDVAPSLINRWEWSCAKAWPIALANVKDEYPQVPFPYTWPYDATPATILNQRFW